MKNEQEVKDLLIEAYNSSDVCQRWKDKIEKVYPEVAPKLEIGKWYKEYKSNRLVFHTGKYKDFNIVCGYGFAMDGWNGDDSRTYGDYKGWRLATDKEVEQALIKEAKKRGFKKGCKADLTSLGFGELTYSNDNFKLIGNNLSMNNCWIMKNGKWATIIKEFKEIIVDGITYVQKQ